MPNECAGERKPYDAEIAPAWHTAALVALITGVAALGTWLTVRGVSPAPTSGATNRVIVVYLPMLAVQWGLAAYVCRIGRPKNALRSLVGETWSSASRAAKDVASAALCASSIVAAELGSAALFGARRNATVIAELPHTTFERLVWLLVAVSAGICEELVYRGYLLRQFEAFARSRWVAVVLQAALFGLAHAEQGAGVVVRFAVYGVLFAALTIARRSLLPAILAHVAIDVASAFVPW